MKRQWLQAPDGTAHYSGGFDVRTAIWHAQEGGLTHEPARSEREASGTHEARAGKAWQRVIREKRAAEAADEGLFGAYWQDIDTDIRNAEVRPITHATAENVISVYEWLGTMSAGVRHCFGIYYDDVLAGVAVYSNEYSANLPGRLRNYGFTDDNMILLSRGACVHWAHPHSGSKLIRRSMDMLPRRYEVVTATADERAGEVGTIYQACGFYYVGRMAEASVPGWLIGGQVYSSRAIRKRLERRTKHGTMRETVLYHWPDAVEVPQPSKVRYFAFRGTAKSRRQHYRAISHLIKPYPKRAAGVEETSLASSEEVLGQFQPAAPTAA